MPNTSIQSLLARFEADYEEVSKRAEKLYAAISGLRAALELESEKKTAALVCETSTTDDSTRSRGELVGAIRGILPNLPDGFTVKDVASRLSIPEVADASVSSALRRMANQEALKVVEPGAGKRPTKYRVNGHAHV